MKVFILILILGLTLQIYILPQYSSIEVKENSYIYLDLSNYEKDIIYIDIDIYRNGTQKSVNDETQYYLNIQLYYFFSNIIYSDGYHSNHKASTFYFNILIINNLILIINILVNQKIVIQILFCLDIHLDYC